MILHLILHAAALYLVLLTFTVAKALEDRRLTHAILDIDDQLRQLAEKEARIVVQQRLLAMRRSCPNVRVARLPADLLTGFDAWNRNQPSRNAEEGG